MSGTHSRPLKEHSLCQIIDKILLIPFLLSPYIDVLFSLLGKISCLLSIYASIAMLGVVN